MWHTLVKDCAKSVQILIYSHEPCEVVTSSIQLRGLLNGGPQEKRNNQFYVPRKINNQDSQDLQQWPVIQHISKVKGQYDSLIPVQARS